MTQNIETRFVQPTGTYREHLIENVYKLSPTGTIVPSVNDKINDWDVGIFKVIAVDETLDADGVKDYTPVIQLIQRYPHKDEGTDLQTALTQFAPRIHERAWFSNVNEINHITLDPRYTVPGSDVTTCRLFKGIDTTVNGTVISKHIITPAANGNPAILSVDTKALSTVMGPVDGSELKRPPQILTNSDLKTGEVVTLVVYTDSGMPADEQRFMVVESDIYRPVDYSTVYITDITLESKHRKETDTFIVMGGTAVTTDDFTATLHYSDGTSEIVPIDGNVCRVAGLSAFNINNPGVINGLTVIYVPPIGTPILNSTNPDLPHVSRVYQLQAAVLNTDFAFKAFVVPSFDGSGAYTCKWYLGDVNHGSLVEIHPDNMTVRLLDGGDVDYTTSSGLQDVEVVVDVGAHVGIENSIYVGYIHSQIMKIEFSSMGSNGVPWVIQYGNIAGNVVGDDQFNALATTPYTISLLGKYNNNERSAWIEALYASIEPIFNPISTLATFPEPTGFKLRYRNSVDNEMVDSIRYPIAQWSSALAPETGHQWTNGQTVEIIWYNTTLDVQGGEINKVMGVTPVPVFVTV